MSVENEFDRAKNYLFDSPLYPDIFTEQYLRETFDGTVFNGTNGIQVVFDEKGGLFQINSFEISTGGRSTPFLKVQGGWKGEGGFYGDTTLMGYRLNAVLASTRKEWQLWKETEDQHPGQYFRSWKKDYVKNKGEKAQKLESDLRNDFRLGMPQID